MRRHAELFALNKPFKYQTVRINQEDRVWRDRHGRVAEFPRADRKFINVWYLPTPQRIRQLNALIDALPFVFESRFSKDAGFYGNRPMPLTTPCEGHRLTFERGMGRWHLLSDHTQRAVTYTESDPTAIRYYNKNNHVTIDPDTHEGRYLDQLMVGGVMECRIENVPHYHFKTGTHLHSYDPLTNRFDTEIHHANGPACSLCTA